MGCTVYGVWCMVYGVYGVNQWSHVEVEIECIALSRRTVKSNI
jgi:hypothetical protein